VLKLILDKKLSVDDLKRKLDALSLALAAAPFDTSECAACPHNSATQASLFDAGAQNSQCRNPTCYQEKTNAHIGTVKARLEETYNKVELSHEVPANTTSILVANGSQGVGAEQLEACTGCESFGAMIDTAAGNRARTIDNVCFNTTCHAKKVKAYQGLIATDRQPGGTAPTPSGSGTTPAGAKTGAGTDKAKAPTAKAEKPAIPKSILKRHHEVRREAAASALMKANDLISAQIVCILSLAAENPMIEVDVSGWPKGLHGKQRQEAAMLLAELTDDERNRVQCDLVAKVLHKGTKGDGENGGDTVGGLAEWYAASKEADLTKHFKVDAEYLAAFTKPAIGKLLADSGYATHYNKAQDDEKAFTKLMKESKKDLLETIKQDSFDFSGFLPEGLKPV
jgi:PRTRC genetic system ParB family protein